uniref:RNase H type-1 domain-containing protein n=1 Tax=Nicotiana tabacum TaxID=4097 RepID=A0A1S3YFC3_TOBAC|nr:PREDICTED: uncharacterized protein LOC107775563 [Nicotiana tabacum]
MAVEYCHVAARQNPLPEKVTLNLKWQPPKAGTLKLNIDGVAYATTRQGGIGSVFRNNSGDWVMSYMKCLSNTIGITSEFQALWQGLRITIDHMLSPIVIDTDFTKLGNPAIGHSYGEQNQVADLLTKEGAKNESFEKTQFLAVPPVFANDAVWADILGTSFRRKINICNIDTLTGIASTQGNSDSHTNKVILQHF